MKTCLIYLLTIFSATSFAQDKSNYVSFNRLTDLEGTDYVIATIANQSKLSQSSSELLFINVQTGDTTRINFPKNAHFGKIEQVRIDKLNLNKVVLSAKTVNLDDNKTIDWNDPMQILVLSTDGREKTKITDDRYFVSNWVVNRETGIMVITGHYDTNNNGKYDRADKHEIVLYDLKAMKTVKKI